MTKKCFTERVQLIMKVGQFNNMEVIGTFLVYYAESIGPKIPFYIIEIIISVDEDVIKTVAIDIKVEQIIKIRIIIGIIIITDNITIIEDALETEIIIIEIVMLPTEMMKVRKTWMIP